MLRGTCRDTRRLNDLNRFYLCNCFKNLSKNLLDLSLEMDGACEEQTKRRKADSDLPPPSRHMHLGSGLAAFAKSRRTIALFDDRIDATWEEPAQTSMSESDLLSLFEIPSQNAQGGSKLRSPHQSSSSEAKDSSSSPRPKVESKRSEG